jgi:hypothetical protein
VSRSSVGTIEATRLKCERAVDLSAITRNSRFGYARIPGNSAILTIGHGGIVAKTARIFTRGGFQAKAVPDSRIRAYIEQPGQDHQKLLEDLSRNDFRV